MLNVAFDEHSLSLSVFVFLCVWWLDPWHGGCPSGYFKLYIPRD